MYGLIAVPVVALGAAYGMGAFSTSSSPISEDKLPAPSSTPFWKNPDALNRALEEEKAAKADSQTLTAGRRKKTKKTKSKNKKTKRRR